MIYANIEYKIAKTNKTSEKEFFNIMFTGSEMAVPTLEALAKVIEFERKNKAMAQSQKLHEKINECFTNLGSTDFQLERLKLDESYFSGNKNLRKDLIANLKSSRQSYIDMIISLSKKDEEVMKNLKYSTKELVNRFHAVLKELNFDIIDKTENDQGHIVETLHCNQYNAVYVKEVASEMIYNLQPEGQKDEKLLAHKNPKFAQYASKADRHDIRDDASKGE